jgi:hypothetical protein
LECLSCRCPCTACASARKLHLDRYSRRVLFQNQSNMKRISSLRFSIFALALSILFTQLRQLHALTESEIKMMTTGWSIDVQQGASKAAASKSGSSTVNGRGTTLGVSEKVLTTSRSLDGTIRLANTAAAPRSVVVRVRWIGRDAKNKTCVLLKQENISLDVPVGKEVTFSASSGEFQKKDVSLTGRQLGVDGTRISGWAVSVREKSSQAVIFSKGSSSEFDRYASSDGDLQIPKAN